MHGLAGLPLALSQVGSFISRNRLTIAKYVEFFKQVCQDSEDLGLFREIEDSGFALEEQRNIWTTWSINVNSLSDRALTLFEK